MAKKVHLTRTFVESSKLAPDSETRLRWQDTECRHLFLVNTHRSRTFRVEKRDPNTGKLFKKALGNYPEISVDEARKEAQRLVGEVKSGVTAHRVAPTDLTVEEVWALFDEKHISERLKETSQKDYRYQFARHIKPVFGHRPIREVTRAEVRAYFEMRSKETKATANKFLVVLSSLYTFAIKRDLAETNPCDYIDQNPTVRRTRRVQDVDLRKLVHRLHELPRLYRSLYYLLLLTGQRRAETISLEWADIDWSNRIWLLKGDEILGYKKGKTKNGLTHTVPLTDTALQVLNDLKRETGGYKFAFFNGTMRWNKRSPGHLGAPTATQFLRTKFKTGFFGDLPRVSCHDLRRTAFTGITSTTGDLIIAKRVVNHIVATGAEAHYDYHHYDPQKRAALEAWERKFRAESDWDSLEWA